MDWGKMRLFHFNCKQVAPGYQDVVSAGYFHYLEKSILPSSSSSGISPSLQMTILHSTSTFLANCSTNDHTKSTRSPELKSSPPDPTNRSWSSPLSVKSDATIHSRSLLHPYAT